MQREAKGDAAHGLILSPAILTTGLILSPVILSPCLPSCFRWRPMPKRCKVISPSRWWGATSSQP